jgi:hypothetical protein
MKGSMREIRKSSSTALLGLPQRPRGGGGQTPSESESSGDDKEDEEEGEMIFPHSPLLKNLPSPGDLFVLQMGVPTSPRQAKHPRVDAGGVSSMSS